MSGDGVSESELTQGGIPGALFFGYRPARSVTLQAEAIFVEKGGDEVRDRLLGASDEIGYHLLYLEMPLLAKLTYEGNGLLAPGVFGGVAPAVLLERLEDRSRPYETIDDAQRFDLGLVAGVELGLKVGDGSGKLLLDFRLTQGVTDVFGEEGNGIHNRAFAFTWGAAKTF